MHPLFRRKSINLDERPTRPTFASAAVGADLTIPSKGSSIGAASGVAVSQLSGECGGLRAPLCRKSHCDLGTNIPITSRTRTPDPPTAR
jgi:hypothetical protein